MPLSRRSGLLEWCEGTQPIGEYLVGQPGVKGSGAHSRYRPKDWSFIDCRRHMMVGVEVGVGEGGGEEGLGFLFIDFLLVVHCLVRI